MLELPNTVASKIEMRPVHLQSWLRLIVLCVCLPVALAAQQRVRARIVGTVFDSLSQHGLSGAMVRIVRADDPSVGRSATTDALGGFKYDSVPAGTWLASFLHPVLDSLRLEPGMVRIDITEAGAVSVPLAIPSARTLVALSCRVPVAADMGVIVGDVRRAGDDAPLVGATVEVMWPEWVLQKGRMVTDQRIRTASTDSLGHFAVCGAPSAGTMRAIAWSGADTSGAVELSTTDAGYSIVDFAIAPVERVRVRVDSATGTELFATVRRGRAAVRGLITTMDRRPLSNAIVRVLGSGSQVRTNAAGLFTIVDAGAGTQTVEARAIGYQPIRKAVRLADGAPTTVDMRLPIQRVQLDTVRVVAGRELPVEIRAIERRWRIGVGTIMDGNLVRDRSNLFVTDALRGVSGVTVRQVGGFGQTVWMRASNGDECQASVIFDGSQLPPSQAASISIDELARREDITAIEVYPRPSMVPGEFTSMVSGCGVIAIWTKRGTRGVSPVKPKPGAPRP
jgi:Carboxypeptidase regulatory-like domain